MDWLCATVDGLQYNKTQSDDDKLLCLAGQHHRCVDDGQHNEHLRKMLCVVRVVLPTPPPFNEELLVILRGFSSGREEWRSMPGDR